MASANDDISVIEDPTAALRFGSDYETHFSPSAYLNRRLRHPDGCEEHGNFWTYQSKMWTEAFCSGSLRGKRLLDLGSGPNIRAAIIASKWFSEVYLSDYVASNRDCLKMWWKEQPGSHDWTSFFKYQAEKEATGCDWKDIEKRTRSAIKDILPCDVTQAEPLAPAHFDPFDCITSSLCLEAASSDEVGYRKSMKNVTSLLRPGGHLVLSGDINEPFYTVGKDTFFYLPVSKELLESSVTEAGCNIKSLDIVWNSPDNQIATDGCYFMVATKES